MPAIKPEFFTYDSTRAILEGRKTVTRRAVKAGGFKVGELLSQIPTNRGTYPFSAYNCRIEKSVGIYMAPNHLRGGIIYVREAFSEVTALHGVSDIDGPVYMADFSPKELEDLKEKGFRWKPAFHMPREHARIFLRVTGVWPEHLCDITEKQAMAEGIREYDSGFAVSPDADTFYSTPTEAFTHLWDSTILPPERPLYGWQANPMVWVYEFDVISREEALAERCGA